MTSVCGASTYADAFAYCLRTMFRWPQFAPRAAFLALPFNFADVPSCLFFYRNYRPLGIDEYGGFYTAHYWTLAVEEHFYLLWPMLLLLVKPKRAGKVAFLLAMVVFAWRVIEARFHLLAGVLPQANLLARTDTRMDALLVGMPRRDLLSGYPAAGGAYSLFAALVCARVDHSDRCRSCILPDRPCWTLCCCLYLW